MNVVVSCFSFAPSGRRHGRTPLSGARSQRLDLLACLRSDHSRLGHRGAHAGELGVHKVGKLVTRHPCRGPAVLLHGILPGLVLEGLGQGVDQCLALLGRDAGRAIHAAPVADFHVDALLLERGHVHALQARARGDAHGAHLARRDVLGKLAVAAAAHGDVAAQDGGGGLTTPTERHVVDLGGVHAHFARNHGCRNVLGRAARTTAPLHAAGVLLELVHHILHGLERRVRGQHEHVVFAGQARQGRDLVQADRRLAGDDAAQHHGAHHHHRVGIALAGIDELGQTDRTGGATLVVIGDRRRCARILHGLAQGTAGGIPATAGGGGRAALSRWAARQPDAVILDLTLPGLDGLQVLQQARSRGLRTPVLILTARGTVGDRVMGLNAGADDYLPKPFDLDELEARLRALVRRSADPTVAPLAPSTAQIGAIRYDKDSGALYLNGEVMELTPRELALMHALLAQPGHAVTKERLYELVFPGQLDVQYEAIEVVVYRLRKKLAGTGLTLMTLRGLCYLLRADT